MGEFVPFAGMLFSLLVVVVLVGGVLLFPLTRRLSTLLELRIQERRTAESGDAIVEPAAVDELRDAVTSLQRQVERLAERQDFTERLLEAGRDSERVPVPGRPDLPESP